MEKVTIIVDLERKVLSLERKVLSLDGIEKNLKLDDELYSLKIKKPIIAPVSKFVLKEITPIKKDGRELILSYQSDKSGVDDISYSERDKITRFLQEQGYRDPNKEKISVYAYPITADNHISKVMIRGYMKINILA